MDFRFTYYAREYSSDKKVKYFDTLILFALNFKSNVKSTVRSKPSQK